MVGPRVPARSRPPPARDARQLPLLGHSAFRHIQRFNTKQTSHTAVKVRSSRSWQALEALGANIKMARLKRRISVQGFTERGGVSESTITRPEKGDDGISIGTLTMACLVLGEIERIRTSSIRMPACFS